jgi:hypothetical protein
MSVPVFSVLPRSSRIDCICLPCCYLCRPLPHVRVAKYYTVYRFIMILLKQSAVGGAQRSTLHRLPSCTSPEARLTSRLYPLFLLCISARCQEREQNTCQLFTPPAPMHMPHVLAGTQSPPGRTHPRAKRRGRRRARARARSAPSRASRDWPDACVGGLSVEEEKRR